MFCRVEDYTYEGEKTCCASEKSRLTRSSYIASKLSKSTKRRKRAELIEHLANFHDETSEPFLNDAIPQLFMASPSLKITPLPGLCNKEHDAAPLPGSPGARTCACAGSSARSGCGNTCRHLASSFPKCHIVVPGNSSKMCFRLRRSVNCHWTEERVRGGTSSAQSLKAKGRLLCHIRKEVYLKGKGTQASDNIDYVGLGFLSFV
ncbi:hypothetical protein BGW80DRAFT_589174 [Lactifluus volemus]|nr:hypothetical protein BGW80DRAFT_589174 [Lactifluus volemus]